MNVKKFRKDIISGKIGIDDITDDELLELRHLCDKYQKIKCCTHAEMDEYKDLIMILLDYYTYHSEGSVAITDYEYDLLMNNYIINGGEPITHADIIQDPLQTRWSFVKHEAPGMVGSIKKTYDEASLYLWWEKVYKHDGVRSFHIAPKFDGISSAIKISGRGKLLQAVTRNDGYEGQDITKVIDRARNIQDVLERYSSMINKDEYVWLKTEIVMKSSSFKKCIEEKEYANRRSATSGIVNSPKNLHLAKYLDIIPLACYNPFEDTLTYEPLNSYVIGTKKASELMNEVYKLLSIIRDADYPYRTDGVVIFPLPSVDEFRNGFRDFNRMDIMDSAIAFKVNTNEAYSTVDYGYVSVGPLGYARPMLHVHPVEVNETIVQDVSLGSFDVFASMDLHENEQVIIFSAGDVIPQAKLPEIRYYDTKAKLIKIKKRCPFCNEKLIRNKGTYRCENENCPRVNQGRIINFITKLKAKDVSEATIENLYNAKLIRKIPDIFKLSQEDIKTMEGYQDAKANLIVKEFQNIKHREITVSELLGALGIKGISTKKCRKIIDSLGGDYKRIFKKHPEKLFFELTSGDGIGDITASIFIDFLKENQELIVQLMDEMNIVLDRMYKGNVVFTGFRDPDLEERFEKIGYEISTNVNSNTKAVINASYDDDSSKCRMAIKKGITIVHRSMANQVLDDLSY